jgi:RNA-splicing ligase RtcB
VYPSVAQNSPSLPILTPYLPACQISKESVHVCRIGSKYKCASFSWKNSQHVKIFYVKKFQPKFKKKYFFDLEVLNSVKHTKNVYFKRIHPCLQTPEQKTNLLHFHAKTAYWWPF